MNNPKPYISITLLETIETGTKNKGEAFKNKGET